MRSTGYIINGKYHQHSPSVESLRDSRAATDKLYSHDRQREDHRRDLIQPYDRQGQPNKEFIQEYPTEAANYGFIPKE